jgi:hypothetical protein
MCNAGTKPHILYVLLCDEKLKVKSKMKFEFTGSADYGFINTACDKTMQIAVKISGGYVVARQNDFEGFRRLNKLEPWFNYFYNYPTTKYMILAADRNKMKNIFETYIFSSNKNAKNTAELCEASGTATLLSCGSNGFKDISIDLTYNYPVLSGYWGDMQFQKINQLWSYKNGKYNLIKEQKSERKKYMDAKIKVE